MRWARRTVLFITCDELRADALGNYGGGVVATPNLAPLASPGRRLDRAYTASPWCGGTLLVGYGGSRIGTAPSNFCPERLSSSVPNLYSVLGAAGYRTAHVGKCHYAPVAYAELQPDRTLDYDGEPDPPGCRPAA